MKMVPRSERIRRRRELDDSNIESLFRNQCKSRHAWVCRLVLKFPAIATSPPHPPPISSTDLNQAMFSLYCCSVITIRILLDSDFGDYALQQQREYHHRRSSSSSSSRSRRALDYDCDDPHIGGHTLTEPPSLSITR